MNYGDDDVRAIAILRNDLEPFNSFIVAYHVVQNLWSVFLNPSTQ
jgi:hypothetical protein